MAVLGWRRNEGSPMGGNAASGGTAPNAIHVFVGPNHEAVCHDCEGRRTTRRFDPKPGVSSAVSICRAEFVERMRAAAPTASGTPIAIAGIGSGKDTICRVSVVWPISVTEVDRQGTPAEICAVVKVIYGAIGTAVAIRIDATDRRPHDQATGAIGTPMVVGFRWSLCRHRAHGQYGGSSESQCVLRLQAFYNQITNQSLI